MNEYASLPPPNVNLSWTDAGVNIKLQSKALFAFLVAEKQIRKIRLSDTAQINAVTEDSEHKINLISLARKWAIFCKACVIATITYIYAKADKLVIFLLTCWACWWQMVDLIFLDLGYFGGMRVCAYIYILFWGSRVWRSHQRLLSVLRVWVSFSRVVALLPKGQNRNLCLKNKASPRRGTGR